MVTQVILPSHGHETNQPTNLHLTFRGGFVNDMAMQDTERGGGERGG